MDNRRNIREIDDIRGINLDYWELRKCPICGKEFYARKKYKKITCSEDCYKQYVELHKEDINTKRSLSCYKSYHSKSKEQIKLEHEKAKKTCLEKYGVEHVQQTEEYRKKQSEVFKSMDWSERSMRSNLKLIPKYEQICKEDNLTLIKFNNRFDCDVKCNRCGFEFKTHVLGYLSESTNHNLCRHCYPNINSTSNTKPVQLIENFLAEIGVEYIKNDRTIISPFEIDIYVPSNNVGFEINGNYWHSEFGGSKGKNYHVDKTIKANEKGVKLIHIFEDEINNKFDIVKSRIKNILGKTNTKIYARKCNIKYISYKDKKNFLELNHIDGDSVSKYNIGLYYDNELVCVATFGNRKISGKEEFELIRFASKINTNVVGGFSRLLKHFITDYSPNKIITYADIRWSGINHENTVYTNNGFSFIKNTSPNYFYEDKKKYTIRLNRLNFTKQKLVKRGFNKNKTEIQIMVENGYDRIWDCGSMKFEYTKKEGLI